ncbi:MAG: chromate resistance protein [Hyphomicrobiaceae bacterium]|nr:chromate resistance protein [Hyphomicrobiaceae bacterium]
MPERDAGGAIAWVTRVRPKIVRIACPWLIRRFVDPDARFLFVPHSEVAGVADRFGTTPYDTDHDIWNDDGDRCTFDVMLRAFGLETEPLLRLAAIVRGADTGRLDLAPQSAGLLASSLGFSRMYQSDISSFLDRDQCRGGLRSAVMLEESISSGPMNMRWASVVSEDRRRIFP